MFLWELRQLAVDYKDIKMEDDGCLTKIVAIVTGFLVFLLWWMMNYQ